jgi:CrcB protein
MTKARPGLPLLLAVAAGGAVGGTLRWWLGDLVPDGEGFPWTTFASNLAGTLAACLLAVSLAGRWTSPADRLVFDAEDGNE